MCVNILLQFLLVEDVVKMEIIKNFDIGGNEIKVVSKIRKDEFSYFYIVI